MLVLLTLEIQRHFQIRHNTQVVQLRLDQLEQRNQKLSDALQIAADPRYREGLVRQMGYVHKDELLFARTSPKVVVPSNP